MILGCVTLFALSHRVVAVADLDDLHVDCAADEEYEAEQTNVALLQANITRRRGGGVQVEQESVYHFHIPKIAGSSLQIDARRIVQESGRTFRTGENCFYNSAEGEHVISMVRSPHEHVVSMFRYCIFNRNFLNHGYEGYIDQIEQMQRDPSRQGGDNPTDWEQDPEAMGAIMEQWLQAWVTMLDAGEATGFFPQSGTMPSGTYPNCYAPVNMQTTRFQCTDRDYRPDEVSVDVAIENMRSLWVLGLQEEYATSLCLLHARAQGELPPGCSCESRELFLQTRTNDNGPTARPVISDNMRVLLDRLTFQDQALHEAAMARFHEDVASVEAEFGVTILCSNDEDDGDGN